MSTLVAPVEETEDRRQLNEAIIHLTRSLEPELWDDQTHVQRKHGGKAFQEEKETVATLSDCIRRNRSFASNAVLQGFVERIVRADRLLASVAIQEAINAGAAPAPIAAAQRELAQGDEEVISGRRPQGIKHYPRP